MKWYVKEIFENESDFHTAATKARDDVDAILSRMGYAPLNIKMIPFAQRHQRSNVLRKLREHWQQGGYLENSFRHCQPGDIVVVQLPMVCHSVFLADKIKKLKSKGVQVVAVIHDLETIRNNCSEDIRDLNRWRNKLEEVSVMRHFSKIIVHNDVMKKHIHEQMGITYEKLISLRLFDYLMEEEICQPVPKDYRSCVIAGNLVASKSEYVYHLPENVKFALFGPNYSGQKSADLEYHGSFPPNEIPSKLQGGFGVVWDGSSAKTCMGSRGEYLRFNNPHKTSLYLACGIPVVIWKEAALAPFIESHHCGFAVSSLFELHDRLQAIELEEYMQMKNNAAAISQKLRTGGFLKAAMEEAEKNL